jgi:predicted transcriptional regulator
MSSPTPSDVAEVLRKRHEWLPYLSDGSLTKSELCTVLGVSRSTVDRGIADLENVELVERSTSGYQLTSFGQLMSQLRSSYENALDAICNAQSMQTSLPIGQHGEQVLFDGAGVVLPESHLPEKPTRRIVELLTEAHTVRGFTPVVHDQYVTTSYEQVMEGELDFEVIVTTPVLEGLMSLYSEWLVDILDVQAFTICEIKSVPSFGLALFESEESCTVVLAVYADNGLCGIIQNDTTRAIGWAKQLYLSYKDTASVVTPETVHQLD